LNLLFTLTAYPPSLGGAQFLMHQLACHLRARHAVQVLTQWDENRTDWLMGATLNAPHPAKAYAVDGVSVQRISLSGEVRRRLAPWVLAYYVAQSPALARIAEALSAEITPWAANAELIHNCRIGREGLSYASLRAARQRDIPFVFTPVHHPRWGGWWHRHYHQLYRQADAVIALTEAERQRLVGLGVDERRVFVTGMGPVLAETADGARFRARHGLGDDPVVLCLGQKYAYKGLGALLKAAPQVWARFPEARFLFIGPRTPYSRRLFAGVNDPRILELDAVNLQDKTDALAACDIFCLPSTQESFGGVFTEAWSLGKPVIGGDVPAVRTVIEAGQDGVLVPQQAGAIAAHILELLAHPTLRTQMGQRGQHKVNARYTWPRLAQQTEAVYARVLGR
jgi:glycosyltransferase involved in cell wall biosynthesis